MALLLLLALTASPDVAECQAILHKFARQPYEQDRREKAVRELGRIGSPASTRLLESLLEDPFVHLRDEAVSALIALKRRPGDERAESVRMLCDFLRRRGRAETKIHLATALGLIGDRDAVPALIDALQKERDAEVVAALATALARLGDERASDALRRKAQRRSAGRAACLEALAAFPGSAEFVLAFAGERDDAVRAAVVDVLAARRRPVLPDLEIDAGVGERLGIALADALRSMEPGALRRRRAAGLLEHDSWRVRAAAIEAVAACSDPTLLPDLVDRLEREAGRLRADAWNALRALTGKEIPPDAEQWRALLPLAQLPERGGRERRAELPRTTSDYFGLPLASHRIAFVFDVSGSMRDENKIGMARARFRRAAEGLDAEQRYDLFVYRYLLEYPPRPTLERAFGKLTAGRLRQAVDWLERQEARGGGAIHDALVAALDDPEVDTVYLLSDGVPSFGSVTRDYRILQEVRRRNRWRRVAIHTILLGTKGTDRDFMRDLAAATGGIAVDAEGRRLR